MLKFDVIIADVKSLLWIISNEKAPGLDGYNSYFFKQTWDVVGDEVSAAIIDSFNTGKLLKSVNVTTITLILKVKRPSHVSDFRLIACCYIIFK